MSRTFTFAQYQCALGKSIAETLESLEAGILQGSIERFGNKFRLVSATPKKWLVCIKRGKRRGDPAEFYEFCSERAAKRFMRACDMQGCVTAMSEL